MLQWMYVFLIPGTEAQVTSATEKIFAVTELRENILIHLPPKDVLLAQRVPKAWKATIEGSSMLQRALGFLDTGVILAMHSSSDACFCNMEGSLHVMDLTAHRFLKASERPRALIINPLLTSLFEFYPRDNIFLTPHFGLQDLDEVYQSSWNAMFLTQPSTDWMVLRWEFQVGCAKGSGGGHLWRFGREEGVTARDLVDELRWLEMPSECGPAAVFS